jgi:3-oxoacyl-[acyl-carrier protein] reductase
MNDKKVAVITGGGGGIGKKIAEVLAKTGIIVILIDVDQTLLEKTKSEFQSSGFETDVYAASVTDDAAIEMIAKSVFEKFGRIDILVNNAGITKDKLLLRMNREDWNAVIDINLTGVYVCSKVFSRYIMKSHSGRIVNISSVVGQMGNAGQANYSASKAGIIGLTKSIAKELSSKGVTVNAVAPGFIQTRMTDILPDKVKDLLKAMIPLGKLGTVDDIANAVKFLVSDESSYITGQVINVNGGMYM